MALKSYNSKTLVDNWFEDRAAGEAAKIVPDTKTDFRSTTKADFGKPSARPEFRLAGRGARPRMLSVQNYSESEVPRETNAPGSGFSVLPRVPRVDATDVMRSTVEASFGPRSKPSELEKHRMTLGRVSAAGGLAGERADKDVRPKNASGEMFRTGAEPSDNTAVQRTWLYSQDPIFQAVDKPRERIEVAELSLPVKDGADPPEPRPYKQTITRASAAKETSVWMDWHPRHGAQ